MKIFISYRHSEGIAAGAQLIHDGLIRHCESWRVFLDNDYLRTADSFPAVIEEQLASCDVFLVLIDPHWVASVDRLRDPKDWVRREIELTLVRAAKDQVRVVPVLLQGARMPDAKRLPKCLAGLADRQRPPPLRGTFIGQDVAILALHIEGWTLVTLFA